MRRRSPAPAQVPGEGLVDEVDFLPLMVAQSHGMNFEHMPELGWRYGYPLVLGLMLGSAAALAWWFRRKGWL